jgi:hypothetical protein
MENQLITLQELISNADISRLALPETIPLLHDPDSLELADISDNPKRLAWNILCYTDYLMEAGKYFRNQIVADLGAGQTLDGYVLCQIAGARAYIGIEPWNILELYKNMCKSELAHDKKIAELTRKSREYLSTRNYSDRETMRMLQDNMDIYLADFKKRIPAALIPEDVLKGLKRLPTSSVSVLAAGIDRVIVSDDEYASAVEEQIERVLHPDGAFISIFSRFNPIRLRKDKESADNYFSRFFKPTLADKFSQAKP